MRRLIFWITFALYLILYFLTVRFVWNQWVPWNTATDLLALSVVLVIVIPLSALSAEKTLRFIREQPGN